MTNELEKTFFDTFGIEPKKQCYYWDCPYSTGNIVNDTPMNERDCNSCKNINKEVYPQISDRILLELICICSQYGFCPTARNIKDLKPKVLKRLFKLKKNLKNNYEHQGCHNGFVRKVRTLFEEER